MEAVGPVFGGLEDWTMGWKCLAVGPGVAVKILAVERFDSDSFNRVYIVRAILML